ncbi:hypothetical protein HanRHA438_Chr13g0581881 [Helianthus annuus]|uniref:Uncharacterized protein n=1 Tax=Helianthus annuus TaxID=4232 RepID=A0A251SS61_HELAN|nr:hypothetical protein HanXRQr2_Chr13g0570671 [Helianthus annuus]KAJ0475635.1 hypothetical protein HanHA300_Chr13g0467791 [Helianthus annuus]KAJ0479568.1 hypothetical protein HanIR_Chr13g0621501 [Helianthus annuus]KAJ0496417.1 hypothetical protein HanHA89_Chr13g0499521 [Helianthus annuus]KAJ0662476.1 hypothetical protein HanLR1_Chr13g0469951 [Helianthus annuus]
MFHLRKKYIYTQLSARLLSQRPLNPLCLSRLVCTDSGDRSYSGELTCPSFSGNPLTQHPLALPLFHRRTTTVAASPGSIQAAVCSGDGVASGVASFSDNGAPATAVRVNIFGKLLDFSSHFFY